MYVVKADLSGMTFGRWVVLKRAGSRNGNAIWACSRGWDARRAVFAGVKAMSA